MPQQTRRRFLRDAALGGAGLVILSSSRSARAYAANDKLNVALIGVGGRGKWYVDSIPKHAHVVAMCDVNESRAQAAFNEHPEIRRFHDFREMLDKLDKKIDAVTVATPDHTHAMASVLAMKRGKHVLCENHEQRTGQCPAQLPAPGRLGVVEHRVCVARLTCQPWPTACEQAVPHLIGTDSGP